MKKILIKSKVFFKVHKRLLQYSPEKHYYDEKDYTLTSAV